MDIEYYSLTETAKRLGVLDISKVVLDNEKFWLWSGSSRPTTHHYGKGKLAQHVWEVVELCLSNNAMLKTWGDGVDERLLFLAAIFHDIGKVWDYTPEDASYEVWSSNWHKTHIHHITRSGLVWQEASVSLPQKERDEVLHAILAHHGVREWGSPVLPNTRLAWLLHLCDNLSARMDDCYYNKQGERT